MARKEFKCPTCNGDLLLTGDERGGDRVFCPTCGAPSVLNGDPGSEETVVVTDY